MHNYINYQTILKLLLVCVLTATTKAGNTCPAEEISLPCICRSGDFSSIVCPEATSSLKSIFQRINGALKNEDKKFDTLYVQNTGITELEEEVFSDITFVRLVITGESRLTRIHVNAFKSSSNELKEIYFWNESNLTNFGGDYDVLKAFGSLVNLERLYFSLNGPTDISDSAFITPNGVQPKLWELRLINSGINSSVRSIGNYAFYYMTGITNLDLHSYKIEHISRHAFDFFQSSSQPLLISLNNNHLNATSFETESFLQAKRPITLYLGSNRIEYLDENIFLPFLLADSKNYVILGINNPVKCDCKMFWLYSRKSSLESQVDDFDCDDGITFWDRDASDFVQCNGS